MMIHVRLFAPLLGMLLALPFAAAAAPAVLFDQGHGQMFAVEKEGPLQL